MAGTVLGKRSRKHAADAGATPRSRKRVQVLDENNENSHHDDLLCDPLQCNHGDFMHVDDLENLPSPKGKAQVASTVPTKHGQPGRRIPLSPSKVNSHFKTTKISSTVSEQQDVTQTPTPRTPRHRDALSKQTPITPKHRVTVRAKPLTPKTPRTPVTPYSSLKSIYSEARKIFTRSATPATLVGRQNERDELHAFIVQRVSAVQGGCLYVSGPPGTGKSALISEICHSIKEKESVKYAYVNCMSIKSATAVYSTLASELEFSDMALASDPQSFLNSLFLKDQTQTSYLVVLDEVDQLLALDLNALYSLFEWSFRKNSSLILVGISNALDLTDRFLPRLKARNLKPQLLPFLPYSVPEISTVMSSRLRSLLPSGTSATPDFTPFLHPTAIQLISKKIAAQTGDLRKAFDLAVRAIDVVESETKEKYAKEAAAEQTQIQFSPSRAPLGENNNLSSPSSNSASSPAKYLDQDSTVQRRLAQLTSETAPRATVAHVVRITSNTFSNGTAQRLKALNLQQKAVLCSLATLEDQRRTRLQASSMKGGAVSTSSMAKKNRQIGAATMASPTKGNHHDKIAAPTLRGLFEAYSGICNRDNVIHALSSTEFRDVIGNLETFSLVHVLSTTGDKKSNVTLFGGSMPGTPSKRGRGSVVGNIAADERRISACIGLQELRGAIGDGMGSDILKNILQSEDVEGW